MKYRILSLLLWFCAVVPMTAQRRVVQNKPYIDLRPLHFGISLGFNMQDAEMVNVGPQIIDLPEGGQLEGNVLCDVDTWNPGFSVGVLADLRLSRHFSLRFCPSMHFGQKHLLFRNLKEMNESGKPLEISQDLKNTYISVPIDLKFSAERFNNYRPYIMAGLTPMLNLAGKNQDYVALKRTELMLELGRAEVLLRTQQFTGQESHQRTAQRQRPALRQEHLLDPLQDDCTHLLFRVTI